MFRITNMRPRRLVCFYGEVTLKLSTLAWVGTASFTANLLLLSLR